MDSKISIIMPVFNEEKTLRDTLVQFHLSDNEELIVVDGGSTDNTVHVALEFTRKAFVTETGRASVMNFGAEKAGGGILLFLHADCILPDGAFGIIRDTLRDKDVAAGAFYLGISHHGPGFRIIEFASNIRSRLTSLIYGDQGMFLRKEIFERIGGFANISLMEDIEISRRLRKTGKVVFVRPAVRVSARRWLEEGIIYTTLRDWTIASLYSFFGVSPDKLSRYYREIR